MKYTRYHSREERPWKIHPIWRGIGFVWMILLPIMSYSAAWMITRDNFKNHWLPVTTELSQQIRLPVINWSFLSFPIDLNILIRWLPGQPLYYIDVLFFIAFLFIGFGTTSVIYAFLFRAMGPGRSPYDAPEVERERRRRR